MNPARAVVNLVPTLPGFYVSHLLHFTSDVGRRESAGTARARTGGFQVSSAVMLREMCWVGGFGDLCTVCRGDTVRV